MVVLTLRTTRATCISCGFDQCDVFFVIWHNLTKAVFVYDIQFEFPQRHMMSGMRHRCSCQLLSWHTFLANMATVSNEKCFYIFSARVKGSSKIVIIFTRVHSVRWEGQCQGSPYAFSKMCRLLCIAILRMGFKINIFKILFG